MKRVLLVNSTWPFLKSESYKIKVYTPEISTVWPPLGLAYIAANLISNNMEVIIFDRNIEFYEEKSVESVNRKMIDIIESFKPAIVGISATTPLIHDAYNTAKIVKSINKAISVIIGGVHATAMPHAVLMDCPEIDFVVRGEGEAIMLELCQEYPLEKILGISYRKDNRIQENKKRENESNIDKIKYPARHLLDMKKYLRSSTQIIFGYDCKATSIISSRGCKAYCAFCAGNIISARNVRYHSIDYTISEIKHIIASFQIEGLFFVDEMFTSDMTRVLALCEMIIKEKINKKIVWGAQLRVDSVNKEILEAMKRAGCVQVEFGFESGSEKVLHDMKKNITIDQCIQVSKLVRDIGVRQLANIIIGWPTETVEDLKKTIELLDRTRPDFIAWHEFKPLPGSYGWKYATDRGIMENSFEVNEPFLYCNISEQERRVMNSIYKEYSRINFSNTKEGLFVHGEGCND